MNLSDVQILLAAPQAPSGYVSPGSLYNSLGRWMSTTQLNADVSQNNLFPDVTGPQNAAGQVDYQCLFVFNTNSTDTMKNVLAWIPTSSVTGALEWAVAADTTSPSAFNATVTPQAGFITAPTIAPSTVAAFFGPSSASSGGASMPTLAPGMVAALWVRGTAVDSPAFSGAGFNLQVTFDVMAGS